jgi:hypothetical protein
MKITLNKFRGTKHIAIVDKEDYKRVNNYNWSFVNQHGMCYAVTIIAGKNTRMHRFIMNPSGKEMIDHKNGNGLDNRKSNLRVATHQQNMMNKRKGINRLSKYKGVSKNQIGKWVAQICYNKKLYYLGCYTSEAEAAIVYNEKAKEFFGDFALTNSVQ